MAPTNRYNKPLHWLMGFCLQFVNGLLYANRREDKQLPPENNRFPVMWIVRDGIDRDGPIYSFGLKSYDNVEEYWSAVRVRDILSDLKEVNQGAAVGWVAEKALWLWLGYELAGLI